MKLIHRNIFSLLFALLCAAGLMNAEAQQKPRLSFGPDAQITAKVLDEESKPISGADVGIGFIVGQPPGSGPGTKELEHRGKTDSNGIFTASDECGGQIGVGASKSGYYRTYGPAYLFREIQGGKWQPWNPTIEMVLKPIVKPIPMVVRCVDAVQIPVVGTPVGFDLIESDWVAPYGKGKVGDFVFTLNKQYKTVDQPFDITLTVRFANEDDGIQSVFAPANVGSQLRLPRYAPESGYLSELIKSNSRKSASAMIERDYREDQNYFFRVRTLKKDGEIVRAHYGKIDRDIEFWGNEKLRFTYYLNPTPNDRNMEYDPKRNLLRGLKDRETVTNP